MYTAHKIKKLAASETHYRLAAMREAFRALRSGDVASRQQAGLALQKLDVPALTAPKTVDEELDNMLKDIRGVTEAIEVHQHD